MKFRPSNLILAFALSAGITSCVDPSFVGNGYGSGYGNGYGGGGYNSYTVLPSNYSGNAYNHNGVYYTGGRYQTGSYNHQGQTYNNRYYHNGQYYYGGNHQNHSPQQSNANVRVNTPIANMHVNTPNMQQHSNSQFWQGRR